jgi:L-asparaginase II
MNPVLVEVTRGARAESMHRGAAVVADAGGAVAFEAGDIEAAVYPRSAVKAILALPLVESGAADRLGLTDAEIALACASHSGEPVHVATVESMLRKAGRDATCLECGAHWPLNEPAARALAAGGQTATALHNNCSGKHAGFICLASARGEDPAGYVAPGHPTMQVVMAALAEVTSTVLDDSNRAVDGCSIPTHAIPLKALARGFARFGTGQGLARTLADAARRIRAAVTANPFMVGGSGRFDTELMTALGARVFSKGGAEGVCCAALPQLGLGIAVKCDDGAGRATQVMMAALVERFLRPGGETGALLARLVQPVVKNWNGIAVGELSPCGPLLRPDGR